MRGYFYYMLKVTNPVYGKSGSVWPTGSEDVYYELKENSYYRQVFDTKYAFHWAIIELGNGELLEGAVKSWNDYEESDTVQIVMEDGTVILTHYSKVLLFSERP